jgi:small nuclear ribonucleoprotein (snRNP)-like protein
MERRDWKELIGKTIFVKLKSNYQYSGKVTEVVDTGDNLIWVHMKDKFNKLVVFLTVEIVELVER